MEARRPRAAVIGTGFMGRVHLEALRRLGFVEVVAVVGSSVQKARALADAFGIGRADASDRAVLDDPAVDAVHICTPNARHFAMASAALDAGKHVLCEKPLAMTSAEAAALGASASAKALRNCTCYNLRYYPAVQQIRRMREDGELGAILIAQGTYSQDWRLYDTDWNWRVESQQAGSHRAMGDIGSHWCDMVEHVTVLPLTSVCADLNTVHRTRKRPMRPSDTFSPQQPASGGSVDVAVDTEDYGAVLLHLGGRARGAFTVSHVLAGRKNRLSIEISGTRASAAWD